MWPPLPSQPRLPWWVDDRLWNLNLCMANEIPTPPPPTPPIPPPFPAFATDIKRKRRHCSFIEDKAGADNEHDDDDDEVEETDFAGFIDSDD